MKRLWPPGEKIAVIVPAFNEEEFIGSVVRQLKGCQKRGVVHEIIVVSDGSTDKTAGIARSRGATVVESKRNRGKSRAFAAGARACRRNNSTIMLTLDADLKTIRPAQLANLIEPLVCSKDKDMIVGTVRNDLTGISGQRAIRLRALEPLFRNSRTWRRKLFVSGYGLEVALHYLIRRQAIAETDFITARRAEGKNLGVKRHVDATTSYMRARDGLALLLRELRRKMTLLPWEQRRAVRKRLLREARDKEEREYNCSIRSGKLSSPCMPSVRLR